MLRLSFAVIAAVFATGSQAQEGDPAAGERTFRVCAACHAVGEGAKNRVGPELNELFGRKPGSLEGFNYSPAMAEFGAAHSWDVETLSAFLTSPRETVKGTKMAFPGVRSEEDLANLLAYLAQFDTQGMAAE